MPRLKAAGNTKKKKRCNAGRSFPCGYSCQPIGRKCRSPLKGQAATSQEWLKLQASRMEKITPYLAERKARNERRNANNNGGIDSSGDRRVSPTANREKIITARADLTSLADPALVPERLRQFLSEAQVQGVAKAIASMDSVGGFLLADGTGLGKSQPIDEPILTPKGWRKMGDLAVGDRVIAVDGNPAYVTGIFPQGVIDVYRVNFSDGSWTECSDNHLWFSQTWSERRNSARGLPHHGKVRELAEIRETLLHKGGQANHLIPMCDPVNFEARTIPLDPYVIGVLLGDGCLSHPQRVDIANPDEEILQLIRKALPEGYILSPNSGCTWTITNRKPYSRLKDHAVYNALVELGLKGTKSDTKFVPESYKFNSVNVRLSVLQGLMDTDGYVDAKGTTPIFTTVSKQLADDVVFLTQSLGGTARIKTKQPSYTYKGEKRKGKLAYLVTVSLPPVFNLFRFSRKANRVVPKTKYIPKRYIKSVELVGQKECQCISINHPSYLYLTRNFIVTHNTREILSVAQNYADQGKKVLIISPNEVLKPDYKKKTVTGSFDKDSKAMGIEINLNKGEDAIATGSVHVTTYNNLAKIKDQVDNNTVVLLDESHAFKNTDSQRTKHGMEMLKSADKVLYATATPVDKPEHLPYLFRADVFKGRTARETYEWLGLKEKEIKVAGGKTVKKWVIPSGEADDVYHRMTGIFDDMTEQGRMIKREISMKGVDVGFDTITLPKDAHDMLDRIGAAYNYGEGDGLLMAQMLMQQRRQLEPYKIDAAVEHAKSAIAEGDQVVIFASRVNESEVKVKGLDVGEGIATSETVASSEGTLKTLKERLQKEGIEIAELHGGTKTKPSEAMEAFQSGKAKVIIATIESGGTGINLDDVTGSNPRTLIVMTPPFSAVENIQAAGRVWRMTTQSYPKIRYLFSDTNVDDWNRRIIGSKMKALGATVKGELDVLDLGDNVPFSDRPASTTPAPRPPGGRDAKFRVSTKSPVGFRSNKYGGYTPDGRYIAAGEGYIRHENGKWITYAKDQVGEDGTIKNVQSKEEKVKRTNDRMSKATQSYRQKAGEKAHPDPIGAIQNAILSIDEADRDRGAEKNNMGWLGSTRSFGASLARQIKEGKTLSPKQLAAGLKLLGQHPRQAGSLPTQADLNLLLSELDKMGEGFVTVRIKGSDRNQEIIKKLGYDSKEAKDAKLPTGTDKAVAPSTKRTLRTEAVVSRLEGNASKTLAPSRIIGREEYDYPVSDDDNAKRVTEYRIRPATSLDIHAFRSDGSHVVERRQGIKEYGNENLGDWQVLGMGRSPIDAMAQWVDDRHITTNDPELQTASKVRKFLRDSDAEIKTLQENTGEGKWETRVWDLQPHHSRTSDPKSQIMQEAQEDLDRKLSEKRLSKTQEKIRRSLLANSPSTLEDFSKWESTLTPKEQKQWQQIVEIYNEVNKKSAQKLQQQKEKLLALENQVKTVKVKLYTGSSNPLD